jgi:hypothetical protein
MKAGQLRGRDHLKFEQYKLVFCSKLKRSIRTTTVREWRTLIVQKDPLPNGRGSDGL